MDARDPNPGTYAHTADTFFNHGAISIALYESVTRDLSFSYNSVKCIYLFFLQLYLPFHPSLQGFQFIWISVFSMVPPMLGTCSPTPVLLSPPPCLDQGVLCRSWCSAIIRMILRSLVPGPHELSRHPSRTLPVKTPDSPVLRAMGERASGFLRRSHQN